MLKEPEIRTIEKPVARPQFNIKNVKKTALLGWLLALSAFLLILFTPLLTFEPVSFPVQPTTTTKVITATDGFYGQEKDEQGYSYFWTTANPSITFDIKTHEQLKISLELRSAAVTGGVDAPIIVVINDQTVTQIQPAANNVGFQTFSFLYSPTRQAKAPLKLELKAKAYRPASDNRALGTMVKSIKIESETRTTTNARLQILLVILPLLVLLTLGLGLIRDYYKSNLAAYATVLGWASTTALIVGLSWVVAKLQSGFLDKNYELNRWGYIFWFVGLLYLAAFFWQKTVKAPLSLSRQSGLFDYAFRYVDRFARRSSQFSPAQLQKSSTKPAKIAAIDSLTGLRFIAVLLVWCVHIPHYSDNVPDWINRIMFSGLIGVPLFFTLSGFVICYNYYERILGKFSLSLWPYLVARVARIYPMHLFALILAVSINLNIDQFRRNPVTQKFELEPDSFLQQLTMIHGWNFDLSVPSAYLFNDPSWSLTVEFFLYLSFPLIAWTLLKLCRKAWQLITLGVVAGISAFFVPTWLILNPPADESISPIPYFWIARFPPTFLSAFIMGCAAARLYQLWQNKPVSRRENLFGNLALYAVIAISLFIMLSDPIEVIAHVKPAPPAFIHYYYRTSSIYLPCFTIAIFCLARYRTWLGYLLSTRLCILLGEASFSFYLLHYYFIQINVDAVATHRYYYSLFMFVLAYMLALGCYTYIEVPMRRLIRKIAS